MPSYSVACDSSWPHRLWSTRPLCPWDSPGQNTGVGSHSLLQGIFLAKGSNLGLLHCRQILYHLSPQGSPSPVLVVSIYGAPTVGWGSRFPTLHTQDSVVSVWTGYHQLHFPDVRGKHKEVKCKPINSGARFRTQAVQPHGRSSCFLRFCRHTGPPWRHSHCWLNVPRLCLWEQPWVHHKFKVKSSYNCTAHLLTAWVEKGNDNLGSQDSQILISP